MKFGTQHGNRAYPNRPFPGTVLTIEPPAQTEQNVNMFPVLVRINNEEGMLRPGMNTEVEVLQGLLNAIPSMMAPGGRVAIISFHSGEDRLVKQATRAWAAEVAA